MNAEPVHAENYSVRRLLFLGTSFLITAGGFALLLDTYKGQQLIWEDYVVLALFPVLFSQIAIGFMLALFGLYDRMRGGDPKHVMHRAWRKHEEGVPLAATAIVVPVYNEEVGRVAAAIGNMWDSLEKTGQIEHFDFYICSDSNDADHWVEEECAWMSLCTRLNAFGKIFYRKRRHAINGKSGNVADFCRRWGKRYRYMVVLDADSVMSGTALVRLVRAMEANPHVGLLQTQPYSVLGSSLFRRVLQFAGSVYGNLFSQGLSMAQTSSGSYWGHNAIIRVAPFIEFCDLPTLPVPDHGKRHVLSHDTVEAALMRRAGYEVWIAYDEPGSWEEGPPNLSDMLKRDRRWCAGNLQHFWFLFARHIQMGNRLQIWIGLMAYLCSPLWLLFIIAGSFSAYFRMRFLVLSAANPESLAAAMGGADARLLFGITLLLIFLPRVICVLVASFRPRAHGGVIRLWLSALMENVLSILMAPVLMIFHTLFVLLAVSGLQIKWTTQNRADTGLDLAHCLKLYGWVSCLGLLTETAAIYFLGHASLWLIPIFGGWILAPLLAWVTSWSGLGEALRKGGFFLIPEEVETPVELRGLSEGEPPAAVGPLWTHALLCPYVQAVHLSLVRHGATGPIDEPNASLGPLRERLLRDGPRAMTPKDKLRLLWDAESVFYLHRELWARPAKDLHASWAPIQAACASSPLLKSYLAPAKI